MKFILDENKEVVEVGSVTDWAEWFEKHDRTVAKTDFDGFVLSTVFLGVDHSFGEGPPVLFESLFFGGKYDGLMWRYETYEQAVKGHNILVEKVLTGGSLHGFKQGV